MIFTDSRSTSILQTKAQTEDELDLDILGLLYSVGFSKFKWNRNTKAFNISKSGIRLQIVISCTYKPNHNVKRNSTRK